MHNYRAYFNIGISIGIIVITLVLLMVSIFSRYEKRKRDTFLFLALSFFIITYIFNIIFYSYRYLEDEINANAVTLFLTLYFIFQDLSILFISFYTIFCICKSKKALKIFSYLILGISLIFILLIIINIPTKTFFYVSTKLVRTSRYFILELLPFIVSIIGILMLIINKEISKRNRILYLLSVLVVLIAVPFNNIFQDYSILPLALTVFLLFSYLFEYLDRGIRISKQIEELSNQQTRIMISQIQPHFIYNCLSSISELCVENPKSAQEAIDNFSAYLRGNFSNIDQDRLIPFSQEMEHVKTYLKLEKMRFEDRLNAEFDIQESSFLIPSLTLQPMVENAVKHGICKKENGGTVKIISKKENNNFIVLVIDDGIGFDIDKNKDDKIHVGLKNTAFRLERMMNGKMIVSSEVGKGTEIKLIIPIDNKKEGRKNK